MPYKPNPEARGVSRKTDREGHGFTASVFRDQRPYMIQTLTHVWQIERSQLTPGSVVDLLHESITAV
jgi:hypothetical protein